MQQDFESVYDHFTTLRSKGLNINLFQIKSIDWEDILDVKFDWKVTFDQHFTDLWRKSGRKISKHWVDKRL